MKNRIFKMFDMLIQELELKELLTFKENKYFLNYEYDFTSCLLHTFINKENYDLNDYYLGEKQDNDRFIYFNNLYELNVYLCDMFIVEFNCLLKELENGY